jgi:hypothetical protein
MGGLAFEVDNMRNFVSILLFLLSLKYIEERKSGKFYVLNVLGILFHTSAIFYFPLYFFLHKPIKREVIAVIFVIGVLLFFFRIEYIRPFVWNIAETFGGRYLNLVNSYLNSPIYGKSYGFSIGLVERIFSAILIILYYTKLIKKSNCNILFINAFVCFFVFYFFFSEIAIIVHRVGGLFIFSYWILWPTIIHISSIQTNRILIICILATYINLKMVGMTKTIMYQYDNVLFGMKSYKERKAVFDAYGEKILKQ